MRMDLNDRITDRILGYCDRNEFWIVAGVVAGCGIATIFFLGDLLLRVAV